MDDNEYERYLVARVVALWVLGGCKHLDRPETRQWLRENGYGHMLDRPDPKIGANRYRQIVAKATQKIGAWLKARLR